MIVYGFILLGAIFGALHARRRNLDRADMAQYAAVFGLIGALLGAIVSVVLLRMG